MVYTYTPHDSFTAVPSQCWKMTTAAVYSSQPDPAEQYHALPCGNLLSPNAVLITATVYVTFSIGESDGYIANDRDYGG